MGGGKDESVEDRVKYKIKSAAHQEYNNRATLSKVKKKIRNHEDILGRSTDFQIVPVDESYPVYLIVGQTIFNFVSESTNQAMWSITGNAALLKKTYVPKYIFTLSKVTSSFVNTLFALGAMLLVFIFCRVTFSWNMLFIPVILIQVYIFSLGLGMFLAAGNVFFRDIQYIYSAFLTAWMYVTPIFYPLSQLPENLQTAIKTFNPLYTYITQFRTIVLDVACPDMGMVLYGFVVAFVTLGVGTLAFLKSQDRFILYI